MQVVDRQQQRPLDGDPFEQIDGRGEELAALVAEAPARRLLGRDLADQRGKRGTAQLVQQPLAPWRWRCARAVANGAKGVSALSSPLP